MSDLLLLDGTDSLLLEAGGDSLLLEEVGVGVGDVYVYSGQHATDFREYRRGRLPGDWTELLTPGINVRVEGAWIDLPHRNALRLAGHAEPIARVLTWNAPDSDSNRADQEVHGRFRVVVQAANTLSLVTLRASTSGGLENGYRLRLNWSTQQVEISKIVAGASTTLTTYSRPLKVGVFYVLRYRAEGSTLFFRMWHYGDTEPSLWDISVIDSSLVDGSVGVRTGVGTGVIEIPYFAVGTNGASAPSEATMPEPMDKWLHEPDEEMELTVRCEYFNPETEAVEDVWYSSHGRLTSATDYPPLTPMDGLVVDGGIIGARLEADAHLGGAALPTRSSLRLNNKPTDIGEAGPLDAWLSYSFVGRPVEVRGGLRWLVPPSGADEPGILNPHRNFEMIGPAIAAHEPDISDNFVTLPLTSPVSLLSDRVRVRRNIGVPTGVKNLTSSGWLLIPSNAAYDLTSYTVYARLYVPSGGFPGTGLAEISKRENGLGYLTWYLAVYQASHATSANQLRFAAHSNAGTLIIAANLPISAYLGGWVSVIFGVKGSVEWYGVINDDLVTGGTVAANPAPNTGVAVRVLGSGVVGGVLCDHRIEQWVNEDEARARFSARREPDSLTISMHRCDDATGSTVTDYAPLANHGTLQGGDNADRSWVPTYLGSAEVAGAPMPWSGGVLYHAPTQGVDPVRNIFRYSDRAKTAGSAIEIRTKGTVTAAYTEPAEAQGAIDVTGTIDQPVTYGLYASPGSPESSTIHVPILVRDELIGRGILSATTCDLDSFDGLRQLLRMKGGFHFNEPPSAADFMGSQLGPISAFFTLDRDGRVCVGSLLPPINPGPYGQESALEFLGLPNRGVTFSPNASFDLDDALAEGIYPTFGVGAWIQIPTRIWIDPAATMGTYFPTGMTIIDRVDGAAGYYLGIDGRNGALVFGAPGATSTATGLHYLSYSYPFEMGKKYFVFGSQDGNTRQIGVYSLDDITPALTSVVSELITGAMSPPSSAPLRIGHGSRGSFYGWIGYVLGVSGLSESDMVDTVGTDQFNIRTQRWDQSTVSALRWTRTGFAVHLTDGEGDVALDSKTGLVGRIEGARWCPRLVFDFRTARSPHMGGMMRPKPAWSVDARYKINYRPLSGADVAPGVSASDRIALGLPSLSETDVSQETRQNYLNSFDVTLSTPLLSQLDADFVGRLVRYRQSEQRRFVHAIRWYREMNKLSLSDEVLVYADRYGMSEGRPMRAATLASRLAEMVGDVGMWG